MMKNKILLFITLILLLLSVSYAAEVSNDATSNDDTPTKTVQTSTQTVEQSVIKEEANNNKEIRKTVENKTTKTASTTVDVKNFKTLHDTLTNDKYDTVTLNIKSNIKLEDSTILKKTIKTLTINGNGKTINGNNQYQFLNINSNSKVTIKNLKITNCIEAIGNSGNLKIINTTLQNNKGSFGGAIINGGTLTITYSTLQHNTAKFGGGAIVNEETLTITDSTLQNNTANEHGGAIGNRFGTVTITDSTLLNNKAAENGGAIYNDAGTLKITKSTLNSNTAKSGSAIYNSHGKNVIIDGNTFIKNKAETTGKAIINKGTNTTIKQNTNDNTSIYSSTVYTDGKNTRITNNVFEDKTNTKIAITKITNKQYKDNITITGKFTNNDGTAIGNTELKLSLNGKNITVKTDSKGVYKYNTKANNVGKNNITLTFAGNTKYKKSTNKTTFTVTKRTTKATITEIAQKTYKQNMTITGKLTDKTGTILKNVTIKVKLNNKTYTLKTNSKGVYTVKVIANRVGTNNVTVTYAGNRNYNSVTTKTTFKTIARATKLTVNKISDTSMGKTVKITGKFTDNLNSPVMNSLVNVKVNTKTVSIKTDMSGIYSYNYKTTSKGTNNVTVTFPGSTNYKASNVNTTFKVN